MLIKDDELAYYASAFHCKKTVRNVMPDQLPKTLFYLLQENVQMAIKGLRSMHG